MLIIDVVEFFHKYQVALKFTSQQHHTGISATTSTYPNKADTIYILSGETYHEFMLSDFTFTTSWRGRISGFVEKCVQV